MSATVNVALREDRLKVTPNDRLADREPRADARIPVSVTQQAHDVFFPRGQRGPRPGPERDSYDHPILLDTKDRQVLELGKPGAQIAPTREQRGPILQISLEPGKTSRRLVIERERERERERHADDGPRLPKSLPPGDPPRVSAMSPTTSETRRTPNRPPLRVSRCAQVQQCGSAGSRVNVFSRRAGPSKAIAIQWALATLCPRAASRRRCANLRMRINGRERATDLGRSSRRPEESRPPWPRGETSHATSPPLRGRRSSSRPRPSSRHRDEVPAAERLRLQFLVFRFTKTGCRSSSGLVLWRGSRERDCGRADPPWRTTNPEAEDDGDSHHDS